ncbi:MAG: hypothetical protein GY913_01605 [Proteobacteria bacterium]|nr:hypothetical protein [Pseudomonadota bacterium]
MLFTLLSTAFAGDIELLPMGPLIADGETPATIQLAVSGAMPGDKVKLKPFEGTASGGAVTAPGVVSFSYLAPRRYDADGSKLRVIVKGDGVSADETVTIPVLPEPKSTLELSFDQDGWTVGDKGTVTVTVKHAGQHPLPDSARTLDLEATSGRLGKLTQADDGSWTTTWTPPTGVKVPTNVLFTATDLTTPDDVVGLGFFPLFVQKEQTVKASKGSQNVLVIGQNQYGPVTAGDDDTVKVDALLDPRITEGMLQSVDETGYRSDTRVDLELGSPQSMAFAPLPDFVPTGRDVRVHVALLEANGEAWSGAAPKLDGKDAESLGKGWYAFDVTTPAEPGSWKLAVTADGDLSAERSVKVLDAVPSVSVSSDPAALTKGVNTFAVTAHLKDAGGTALIKRYPVFSHDGVSLVAKARDNGDGTYTAKYKMSTSGETGSVSVHAGPKGTGLPVARLVMWPLESSVAADGSSTTAIAIVAEDAYGMPVPNVEVSLTTPIGDGAMVPTAKTDKFGFASVSYRAGSAVGPAGVVADANGVMGATILFQHPTDGSPVGVEAAGSEADLTRAAFWRAARPTIQINRIGADVGPPAFVNIQTTPNYTTPGAAILVTLRVTDSASKAVLDAKPQVTASIGKVGAITNNGDGSFNVPVQLPAGQDGPITLSVQAGPATGSVVLPTLASLGGAPPATADSGNGSGGDDFWSQTGDASKKATKAVFGNEKARNSRAHLYLSVGGYKYIEQRKQSGDLPRIPSELVLTRGPTNPVPGGGFSIMGHPKGGMVGYDVRLRFSGYTSMVESELFWDGLPRGMGAARAQFELAEGLNAYATAGVSVFDVPIYRYTEDLMGIDRLNKAVPGLRLGGGATFTRRYFHMQFELAESFGPLPKMTETGLLIEGNIPLGPVSLIVFIEEDVEFQHARYWVGTGDSRDQVGIKTRAATTLLGWGVAF